MCLRRLRPAVPTFFRVMNCYRALLCFAMLVSVSAANLAAQGTNAAINGQITDPQGKVVPGTEVQAVDIDTNIVYSTKANSSGIYVLPRVPPGRYRLMVRKDGFKVVNKTDITLHVQDILEQNFALEVGSVSESVTVEGGSQIINTTDGSVSTVIDRKFVENIPLNGRSFQDLISMTPGVVTQSPQNGGGIATAGDFSVNGQRTESNYYTVDGVAANNSAGNGQGPPQGANGGTLSSSTALGTTQSLISVDALQEFRVQSSSYSAEYGGNPGGQFSLATRSGTNELHGSAFDYLRNDFFDANDWFNDHYGQPISALRQNDFGITLGSRVVIPKLYDTKDRTFFFVSYEGLRLTQPTAASLQYVPDNSIRARAPSALQPILNAFPQPTVGGLDYGNGLAQFIASYSLPSEIDSTSIRVDHVFAPHLSAFFRVGYTPSSATNRNLSELTQLRMAAYTYTAGITSQLSKTWTNELRVGYAKSDAFQNSSLDSFEGAQPTNLASAFGLGSYASPFQAFYLFVPAVGESYIMSGSSQNKSRQWNIVDSSSITVAKHQIAIGVNYRRINSPVHNPSPNVGAIYFGESDILSNDPTILSASINKQADPVFNDTAAFVQDEWHILPRLNLSLGVRWEVAPPPSSPPYTVTGSLSDPASISLAPLGTPLWRTTYHNFAPRFGIAWTAHDRSGRETVLRSGGGVFFDNDNEAATQGYTEVGFATNQSFSGVGLPFKAGQINTSFEPVPPYQVVAFPSHLQLPYTLQWNVSLQQELGTAQSITISYVASNGRRLIHARTLSIPAAVNPNIEGIALFPGDVTSNYQSMQTKFERYAGNGIHVFAAYTWSHSLDLGSNYAALPLQRGDSAFDVRNNMQAGLTWNIPDIHGNLIARSLLNSWGLDGRLNLRTGFPVTLNGNLLVDPATNSEYHSGLNVVPNQPLYVYSSQYPGGRAINGAAFTLPSGTEVGNAPRNFVRGFGEEQVNIAARRTFPLSETVSLEFRAEAFNILNHPNFGYIDPTLTDATFGQATQMLNQSLGTLSSLYQQGGARSMQFALKLRF